jgi:hypothetical protein
MEEEGERAPEPFGLKKFKGNFTASVPLHKKPERPGATYEG